MQNPKQVARNYIPPQLYKKYMFLSNACRDYRTDYKDIKTQLRFTEKGIEIMIKTKGSGEPYKTTSYNEIMDTSNIPQFDHSLSWNIWKDRPARKIMDPSPGRDAPPSMRNHDNNSIRNSNKISRQRSVGSQDQTTNKRTRNEQENQYSNSN